MTASKTIYTRGILSTLNFSVLDRVYQQVGGELGINIANYDINIPGVDDTNTDIGLSAVGDYRLTLNSGKTLLLEAKLGISDSPDFKFTVGWNL